jgi:hypothetical protein
MVARGLRPPRTPTRRDTRMAKSKGMTGKRWRELKNVGPRFRWATDFHGNPRGPVPASARRAPKESSSIRIAHGRRGRQDRPAIRATSGHRTFRGVHSTWQQREPSNDPAVIHLTQSPPWKRKAQARRKTALAKASRKANRG